jgi:site-specific DNA-methyltransferase (adenine-specific)
MEDSNFDHELTHKPVSIHEPIMEYGRNKEIPTFFGQPMLRGRYASLDHADLHPFAPSLFYSQEHGEIWVGDAVAWLRSLESASADLVFADPPYNIKKAEWDTVESQEEYVAWSIQWIQEAAQVLKQNGTLYVCGFSEILADIKLPASRYFQGCRWLERFSDIFDPRHWALVVSMIT